MPRRPIALAMLATSFLALVLGTTRVGYLHSSSAVVAGASGDLGFDNTLAYTWYLLLLVPAAGFLARLMTPDAHRPRLELRFHPWPTFSKWVFGLLAAGYVLLFGSLYLLKGRLPFSEGIFFQAQLYRMTQGERPYVDFAYYYGPAMIYPSYWLSDLLPLELAYAISFVASYVVGIFLLFVVVRAFVANARTATWWSAFLAIGLFDPMTGLNATLVRYLLPTIVFLLTKDLLASGRPRAFLLAAMALAFGLLLSFEVAVLSAAAVGLAVLTHPTQDHIQRLLLAIGGRTGETDRRIAPERANGPQPATVLIRGTALGLVGLAVALVFFFFIDPTWLALRTYPLGAVAFLSGAYNAPVTLSVPFVVVAGMTVLALGWLFRLLSHGPEVRGLSLVAAYVLIALAAQRKVFAAPDPVNVAYFTLPTLLVCLLVTSQTRRGRVIARGLAAFVLAGFMLPLQLYFASQLFPTAWPFSGARASTSATSENRPVNTASVETTLALIVEHAGRDHPYLMYGLEYYSVPVYHRFGLRYANYLTDLTSIPTADAVQRAIEETRSSDARIVIARSDLSRRSAEAPVSPQLDLLAQATGTALPGSELRAVLIRNSDRLLAPFLDFVRREYHETYELNGIVLLERNDRQSAARPVPH